MPDNKRIFYALEQLGFALDGVASPTFLAAHGVQSCGITTNFNLEQVFELGQLAIYQQVENIPDIELTVEKVLDGYPLLYHLLTHGASVGTLIGRSNVKSHAALSIFADTSSSATGTPVVEVHMSGLFLSAVSYTFPVEGNATESITAVGNTKTWIDVAGGGTATFVGAFNNQDQPLGISGSGGVQRRQHVIFVPVSGGPTPALDINGMTNQWCTVLPNEIYGITSSGTNPMQADGSFAAHIQSISVSADLSRDQIFELGRKYPYYKFVTFPVEVRTEIEVLATKWDGISATEAGGNNGAPAGSNIRNQTIRVRLQDSTMVDLGLNNKLTSIAFSGGDAGAGGGNVTNRFSYTSYNDFLVTQNQDPSGL